MSFTGLANQLNQTMNIVFLFNLVYTVYLVHLVYVVCTVHSKETQPQFNTSGLVQITLKNYSTGGI